MNIDSFAAKFFADCNATTIEKILVPCGSNGDASRERSVMVRVSDA
jgi:hypothetical protein